MILINGTKVLIPSIEMVLYEPVIVNDRKEATVYIRKQFEIYLKSNGIHLDPLPSLWELGVSLPQGYSAYTERQGEYIAYHLRSESTHIIYRIDNISGDNISIYSIQSGKNMPLYWSSTSDTRISTAILMAAISSYAGGKAPTSIDSLTSYESIFGIIPSDDTVTPLFIEYSMLKNDGKNPSFIVDDGLLSLTSDDRFASLDIKREDIEDGEITDPRVIYDFSPMYYMIPDSVEETVEMLSSHISTNNIPEFITTLREAMNPGINWGKYISSLLPLLSINQYEIDDITYKLMRIIGKHKLIKGAERILSE